MVNFMAYVKSLKGSNSFKRKPSGRIHRILCLNCNFHYNFYSNERISPVGSCPHCNYIGTHSKSLEGSSLRFLICRSELETKYVYRR